MARHLALGTKKGQDEVTKAVETSYPILIVEDNPVSRKLLEKTLKKGGYKVVSASSGEEALEKLKKEFFPIVITDWMMPGMDGLELCRQIRTMDLPGYVFIIVLTAKDTKEDHIEGLEAGADDYLTKPFNFPELKARLKSGIRILELERSLRKANEEIRLLSITDSLTGCYNRHFLMERLRHEIKRARRYDHPLSVIMCDIDHFKKVNDVYGHQAGDLVLKSFAQTISSTIRKDVDWIARYGGEEFLVILPETTWQGAMALGERIRQLVAQTKTETPHGDVVITASFGVTGLDRSIADECVSMQQLINAADTYMYLAKEEGRDRVKGGPLSEVLSQAETLQRTVWCNF